MLEFRLFKFKQYLLFIILVTSQKSTAQSLASNDPVAAASKAAETLKATAALESSHGKADSAPHQVGSGLGNFEIFKESEKDNENQNGQYYIDPEISIEDENQNKEEPTLKDLKQKEFALNHDKKNKDKEKIDPLGFYKIKKRTREIEKNNNKQEQLKNSKIFESPDF